MSAMYWSSANADAAEADSTVAVEDPAAIKSGRWLNDRDANRSALLSVIKADIEADHEPEAHSDTPGAATAQADGPPIDHSSRRNGESNQAAESISQRYSSQQSVGTNFDWDSDAPEVSSKPTADSHAKHNSSSSSHQQQSPSASSGPGDAPPAKSRRSGPQQGSAQAESRTPASRSGQQANAMAEDVQGMAPNPASSMIGEEGGGRPWLKRAFSLVDQENCGVNMNSHMDSLDKVCS